MRKEAKSSVTFRPAQDGGMYVNLRGQVADQLVKLAETQGTSPDEALRNALKLGTQGLTQ